MNAFILFLAGVFNCVCLSVSQMNTDKAPTEKLCFVCLVMCFIFEDLFYISSVCVMGFEKPTLQSKNNVEHLYCLPVGHLERNQPNIKL